MRFLLPVFNMSRYKVIMSFVFTQILMFLSALPVMASGSPDPTDPQFQQNLLAWRVYELTVMARNLMTWIRNNSPVLWIAFCVSFTFAAVRLIKKLKKV